MDVQKNRFLQTNTAKRFVEASWKGGVGTKDCEFGVCTYPSIQDVTNAYCTAQETI